MFIKTLFLIAATALVPVTAGSDPGNAISVLEVHDTPFGALTVYGRNVGDAPNVRAPRQRCGSPGVECRQENVPDPTACTLLAGAIQANPGLTLPTDARAVCLNLGGDDAQCCVTWGQTIPDLHLGSLAGGVNNIIGQCVDPVGSGNYFPADLDGVCTRECLSRVPDGCFPG